MIKMGKSMTIEPWYYCSQDCRFCSSEEVDGSDESLDERYIKEIVVNHEPDEIRWSGGEPTASFRLYFLVGMVENYGGIRQIINTCGQFSYKNWKDLFERVDCVRFSLLGDKIGHDYMTDGKNYGVLMDNLMKCVYNDDIDVQLTTPYFGENYLRYVLMTADNLDLKVRVAALVHPEKYIDYYMPNNLLEDFESFVEGIYDNNLRDRMIISCSLDRDKPCKKGGKILVYPDGSVHNCATEKIGFCPRKNYEEWKDG